MRVAPSHSFVPSTSGISRMPSVNGTTGGGANGAAHSAFRLPTSGTGAITGAGRATTSWNTASHAQLQHVNTNLSSAVKANTAANAAVNHSLASAHLHSSPAGVAK